MISSAAPLVNDSWIWDSAEAKQAMVGSWRGKAGDWMVTPGFRRLQAAFLHTIGGDHFYAERRRMTTCDADWFEDLLQRFVGKDRTRRSGELARAEWAAVTTVLLGLVVHGDEHRFRQANVCASLQICLAAGSVERLSKWAEELGEEDLAELAYCAYLWLPSMLLSMASQAGVMGASRDEPKPSYFSWCSGPIVIPQVMSLGMRWFEGPYEFDYADDMEFEDRAAEELGQLALHRVGFDDEEVELLVDDDEEAWNGFRVSETSTHVSELVKLVSSELGQAIAVAALDITWETAVDPNVLPSEDLAVLYPKKAVVELANAEQKLQVNLRQVWWQRDLGGLEGLDEEAALRLIGLGIGKQLAQWMKESMALRVKPGVPVTVHITPEPGRTEWDGLLWTLADEIPRDDLWEGSPDAPCLTVSVERVAAGSDESAYPVLGSVLLEGEAAKKWAEIREAAYFLGQYGKACMPIVLGVSGGVSYMYAGLNRATYTIELRDDFSNEDIRRKFASSKRRLLGQKTLAAITSMAAKAGKPVDDFAVMFVWGFFSMDLVFDAYVLQEDEAWRDVYLDGSYQGVCSMVVLEEERNRLMDEHGKVAESYIELFWSRVFPRQLRTVMSPQSW